MSDVDSGNNLTEENKKEEEEPLAILNLEIEKGVIKQIKLYKNSKSEEVAYNFCKENNIDFSLLNQIKNEIDSLMQQYFKIPSEGKNSQENALQKNNSNDIQNNYINSNTLNDGNNNYRYYTNNTKSNLSNNVYNNNNRKLFFYQLIAKDKNQNSRRSNKNNSNGYKYKQFKPALFNTITSTKSNNFNKISRIKSGKSYKYNNIIVF